MYMRFINHTFGLEKHPRLAKAVAVVFPFVMVGGILILVW